MTYYIVVRFVVILIMILLMIVGLVSVILGSIFLLKANSNAYTITQIWSNDLQCGNKDCKPSINDDIWKNSLDTTIDKSYYQPSVAKRCADLINRIVQAETTSKIVGPQSLKIIGELKNPLISLLVPPPPPDPEMVFHQLGTGEAVRGGTRRSGSAG